MEPKALKWLTRFIAMPRLKGSVMWERSCGLQQMPDMYSCSHSVSVWSGFSACVHCMHLKYNHGWFDQRVLYIACIMVCKYFRISDSMNNILWTKIGFLMFSILVCIYIGSEEQCWLQIAWALHNINIITVCRKSEKGKIFQSEIL